MATTCPLDCRACTICNLSVGATREYTAVCSTALSSSSSGRSDRSRPVSTPSSGGNAASRIPNAPAIVAVTFAAAFQAQALLVPGSINGIPADPTLGDTLYFSVVTITTLGYGDITPVSDSAHMLAYMEALFGQLYIAVLLAKLVATHISSKARAGDSS